MCGISGLWFQEAIKEEILLRYGVLMSNAQFKRGPDSDGVWADISSGIVLSHRRLSIRDLSKRGNQPMRSHDNNLVIVFNGEIYNFEELKYELKNYKWQGTSDTEILLAAIQTWGLEVALRKCYGMFAFALWNIKRKTLIIARDRFGEKPLYWGKIRSNNHKKPIIAFASDLSSIWSIPGIEREIEYAAFSNFLKYGYVCAPNSIQKGIHQLQPGHFVEIKSFNGSIPSELNQANTWWNINNISFENFSNQSKNSNTDKLEDALKKVIKQQSLADVPTASFLSGGIDSSLIAALLQSQSAKKIKTYNISFPDNGNDEDLFDEGPYAKKIADYLNTDHTEISLSSKDILEIIPQIPSIYSEPFADASQLATTLICKEIRNSNIKVALTGDGADELFGGYNRHTYIPLIYKRFKNKPLILKNIIAKIIQISPSKNTDLSQEKKRKLVNSILNSNKIETIYESIISNNIDSSIFYKYPEKYLNNNSCLNQIYAPSNFERVMLADSISYLPNNILVKLDRASMNYGLETRSPFLDERIAKIAWNIKLNNKIQKKNFTYQNKFVLREILFKYIPKEYFNRPKTGFSVPIASWLRGPLKEWANDLMNSDLIDKQDYLCSDKVKVFWESHLKGNSQNTELIWTILMWQNWLEKWKNI